MIYTLPRTARKLAIISDMHIGIHDEPAIKLLIECFEREGCDTVIANGDGHDCAAVSRHDAKRKLALIKSGQLAEEAASGRWLIDWMRTRRTFYGEGNHEDWINDVALATNTIGSLTVASALGLPQDDAFTVMGHGYQLRHGSLVIEHGDVILGNSLGGVNPALNILRRYPAQTTIIGHLHREDYAVHTTVDHNGCSRSYATYCCGHLSDPTQHMEYAGRAPNWQQGGAIVDLWEDAGKPRFTVHLIQIHRDRRNRPIFEFNGHVYR